MRARHLPRAQRWIRRHGRPRVGPDTPHGPPGSGPPVWHLASCTPHPPPVVGARAHALGTRPTGLSAFGCGASTLPPAAFPPPPAVGVRTTWGLAFTTPVSKSMGSSEPASNPGLILVTCLPPAHLPSGEASPRTGTAESQALKRPRPSLEIAFHRVLLGLFLRPVSALITLRASACTLRMATQSLASLGSRCGIWVARWREAAAYRQPRRVPCSSLPHHHPCSATGYLSTHHTRTTARGAGGNGPPFKAVLCFPP